MDNDQFKPQPTESEVETARVKPGKDPYAEPPIKDYSHLLSPNFRPPKKHRRILPTIGLILLVVIILGAGLFFGFQRFHTAAPTSHIVTNKPATPITPRTPVIPTKSYTSAGFGVTFNYPLSWTIADNGAASLNIDSPSMSLMSASGTSVTGKIIVAMAPQGQIPASFGAADTTAVLTSQLVKYSNPTADQRAQTYLTFVQYAATTVAGGLDGIYITGNYGYQKDQDIPRTDVANLNPLVTVTFVSCANMTCASPAAMSVASTSWNDTSFSAPIKTILTSLSFQ